MSAAADVVVVGSGASGVHFAWTALERGLSVTMVDVGRPRPPQPLPDRDLAALKQDLDDPVSWFLGDDWSSLILPDDDSEYYGFPPTKKHVFAPVEGFTAAARGFAPLLSFAQGGLAEAWTGGSYPFDDGDLAAFPFSWSDIEPHYATVARRIGMTGTRDDMEEHFPWHDGLEEPLELDAHSRLLLATYERRRDRARRRGFVMGRARLAVTTRDRDDGRKACDYLGRCLWGCPRGSLWVPSLALERLRAHPKFTYVDGVRATHYRTDAEGRVTELALRAVGSGAQRNLRVERLVLAAGTLATSGLVLESVRRDTGRVETLCGLMDNRQVLMPFVNLRRLGRPFEHRSYQYHQLAIGLAGDEPRDYVHGLVTTLKTALIHPVVQSLPFDLRTALAAFRDLHGALGLVNVNFSDRRREHNTVTLRVGVQDDVELAVDYRPESDETLRLARATRAFRGFLRLLGCIAPRAMQHVRPMGASVHYSGTLPMTVPDAGPFTTTPSCRLRPHPNLWIADGATFPDLPAKNLTFTLMANATRIAADLV